MYAKLFSSIIHSSIWCEDSDTKVVWITLLAMADFDGHVEASHGGLAKAAGLPLEKVQMALDKFYAPDPDSMNQDNEGRRVAKVDRGWLVLNYTEFRERKSKEYTRGQDRQRQQKHRSVTPCHAPSRSVTPRHSGSRQTEADTDTDTKNKKKETKKKDLYGDFVLLTPEEIKKLYEKWGQELTDKKIDSLNEYIGIHGKKYKSHYLVINKWAREDNSKVDSAEAARIKQRKIAMEIAQS
jgi:hypothetical protein